MHTVMLVDDEAGIRASIKAKVDWEAAGFQIVSEASSGEEALRLLDELPQPDLLISDVRMPQMDGIKLASECKKKYPGLKIVMLSGYSDFEYLKSSIQIGVRDYLLKPVVRQEIISLLAELDKEITAEHKEFREKLQSREANRQQLQILQEQLLLQLVKDEWFSLAAVKERLIQLQMPDLTAEQLQAQFVTVEMRIPNGRLEEENSRRDLLHLAFRLMCRETAAKYERIYPFYDLNHPALMCFIVLLQSESKDGGFALQFSRELRDNISRYLRLDSVFGIGKPIDGLRQLKEGYASSMLSWSQGIVDMDLSGKETDQLEWNLLFSPELDRKLTLAIENLDFQTFKDLLHEVFPPERETSMFVFTFLALRVILLFSTIAKKFELHDSTLQQTLWNCQISLRDYQSREQVLDQLHELAVLVMDEVRVMRFSSGQHIVNAIQKFVDQNYCYEITLSSLAEKFYINETYLSSIFKQSVGMTFSEYVISLRMHKAKELLKENKLKLTDIATLVGFSTSSYFSTSFKKFYGKSPKEFREELFSSDQSE
ncbi:response regulator [Paenibacillus caui]|uniref:response regulator n=1 Tax=Paenibacillus caui TaxID=2873927 RepID=UPI001CA8F879|nr:response regulator [Paenibacillus caui]